MTRADRPTRPKKGSRRARAAKALPRVAFPIAACQRPDMRSRDLLPDEPADQGHPALDHQRTREILRTIRDKQEVTILGSDQVLCFPMSVADRTLAMNRRRIIHESSRDQADEAFLKQFQSI